jgi:hypothetical protein
LSTALPPPPDQDAWDEAATAYAVDSLTRIRASAEKWVGTIGTLLGLFGTLVVVAGPEALTDVSDPRRQTHLLVAFGVAGGLAAAAIVVGSLAAQGSTKLWDDWNGETFAAYLLTNGNTAAAQLSWSRWLGTAAAFLVFAAGLYGASGQVGRPEPSAATTDVLVVAADGTVACGVLDVEDGSLRVAGRAVDGVRQVEAVSACRRP